MLAISGLPVCVCVHVCDNVQDNAPYFFMFLTLDDQHSVFIVLDKTNTKKSQDLNLNGAYVVIALIILLLDTLMN